MNETEFGRLLANEKERSIPRKKLSLRKVTVTKRPEVSLSFDSVSYLSMPHSGDIQ
jgi:hypothetical protein